jgi:hypothetical protein
MSVEQSVLGSEPANKPIFFIGMENGLYYYLASCCVPPEHFAIVVSPTYLEPDQLGCTKVPPPGPGTPSVAAFTHSHPPFRTKNELIAIYGYGDIGNGPDAVGNLVLNPAGVTKLHGPVLVEFVANRPELTNFVENRVYQLSAYNVSFFWSHNCECASPPKDPQLESGHSADCVAGTAGDPAKSKACQEVVNVVVALAQCVSGNPTLRLQVEGEFSPECPIPHPGSVVKAGRLLRLRVLAGPYEGNTLLVVNVP